AKTCLLSGTVSISSSSSFFRSLTSESASTMEEPAHEGSQGKLGRFHLDPIGSSRRTSLVAGRVAPLEWKINHPTKTRDYNYYRCFRKGLWWPSRGQPSDLCSRS